MNANHCVDYFGQGGTSRIDIEELLSMTHSSSAKLKVTMLLIAHTSSFSSIVQLKPKQRENLFALRLDPDSQSSVLPGR